MSRADDSDWTVITQRAYDRERNGDLATVIIEAVAAAEGAEPASIKEPPLYDIVDISAIEDGFFGLNVDGTRRDTVGSVGFDYRGFRITVRSDGWVQVAEPSEQ